MCNLNSVIRSVCVCVSRPRTHTPTHTHTHTHARKHWRWQSMQSLICRCWDCLMKFSHYLTLNL